MTSDAPPLPIVRHHRRPIFENRVMRVCLDHVEAADGQTIPDYVVVMPRGSLEPRIAGVTILPVLDGRILLHRMYRHPMDAWFWEAPRGLVDEGECPETAARRELTEETGLVCPAGGLLPLGTYVPDNATLVARGALFAALDCRIERERDDSEMGLGHAHGFTLGEALAMATDSRIEDSSTLLALYRYAAAVTDGRAKEAGT